MRPGHTPQRFPQSFVWRRRRRRRFASLTSLLRGSRRCRNTTPQMQEHSDLGALGAAQGRPRRRRLFAGLTSLLRGPRKAFAGLTSLSRGSRRASPAAEASAGLIALLRSSRRASLGQEQRESPMRAWQVGITTLLIPTIPLENLVEMHRRASREPKP